MEWETPEGMMQKQLAAGERLLWSGRPAQGVRLRPRDAYLIPFGLLWVAFAIVWAVLGGAYPGAMGTIAPLLGLPAGLIGVYLVIGRFVVEAKQRARAFYGLTEKRIIIVSGLLTPKIRSLDLVALPELSVTESGDGTGTIGFGPRHPFAVLYGATPWPGVPAFASSSLDLIPDVRAVHELIRETQSQAQE